MNEENQCEVTKALFSLFLSPILLILGAEISSKVLEGYNYSKLQASAPGIVTGVILTIVLTNLLVQRFFSITDN